MTHRRLSLGKTGEDLAVRHLQALGYRVLARNFRCALGEIDVIAREGDYLVFVEIKTRRGGPMGEAKAAVDERKQRRISRVALRYLKERGQTEMRSRFDVVAVVVEGDRHRIELVRDAFEAIF